MNCLNVGSMRKSKLELTKTLTVLSVVCCFAIGYTVYSAIHCDFEDGKTLIKTPHGRHIKKFDPDEPVKIFSQVSKTCEYDNEKLYCPDVRFKGETMIRQVQLAIIRMMIIFDIVCRKHNIKYWLWRGALLGSHRHRGFIPWDNDLDIGIMKEDYEKFRLVSHELPTDIFVQNASSDPEYKGAKRTTLAKLRDRNGCYGYCLRTGCNFHDGPMIDIFGFYENGEDSIVETTINKVSFNVRKSDIFPLRELDFEGYKLSVPNKYDVILKNSYGPDYNELPSRSRRCPPAQIIGLPFLSCIDLKHMKKSVRNYNLHLSVLSRLKFPSWCIYCARIQIWFTKTSI